MRGNGMVTWWQAILGSVIALCAGVVIGAASGDALVVLVLVVVLVASLGLGYLIGGLDMEPDDDVTAESLAALREAVTPRDPRVRPYGPEGERSPVVTRPVDVEQGAEDPARWQPRYPNR